MNIVFLAVLKIFLVCLYAIPLAILINKYFSKYAVFQDKDLDNNFDYHVKIFFLIFIQTLVVIMLIFFVRELIEIYFFSKLYNNINTFYQITYVEMLTTSLIYLSTQDHIHKLLSLLKT